VEKEWNFKIKLGKRTSVRKSGSDDLGVGFIPVLYRPVSTSVLVLGLRGNTLLN